MKIVYERTLNGHKLLANTWIAAAMNPPTEGYEVDDVFDQAFLSRFIRIDMKSRAAEWLRWAKNNNIKKFSYHTVDNHDVFKRCGSGSCKKGYQKRN